MKKNYNFSALYKNPSAAEIIKFQHFSFLTQWKIPPSILVCLFFTSCVSLQQPLPGSLWGDWAFVQTGTTTHSGNEDLYNYSNVCKSKSDRLSFRSDSKISLRWYDESCMINYYFIGRYRVENNFLIIDLEKDRPHIDSLFPPITKYRIVQMNTTTLKLEEMRDASVSNRERTNTNHKALVFVFMKLDE